MAQQVKILVTQAQQPGFIHRAHVKAEGTKLTPQFTCDLLITHGMLPRQTVHTYTQSYKIQYVIQHLRCPHSCKANMKCFYYFPQGNVSINRHWKRFCLTSLTQFTLCLYVFFSIWDIIYLLCIMFSRLPML